MQKGAQAKGELKMDCLIKNCLVCKDLAREVRITRVGDTNLKVNEVVSKGKRLGKMMEYEKTVVRKRRGIRCISRFRRLRCK